VIDARRGVEESAQTRRDRGPPLTPVELGPADNTVRVRRDAAVDVGQAVEPASRGRAPVDSRRRQAALFDRSCGMAPGEPGWPPARSAPIGGALSLLLARVFINTVRAHRDTDVLGESPTANRVGYGMPGSWSQWGALA
jgi:hypothetical protein